MKSWSVSREPNSALSWQAYDEARLSHAGTCLCWRSWCLWREGTSQKCSASFLWLPRERRKEVRKEQVGGRDKRANSRPPRVVWFFQRPCWRNCFWQGCDMPAHERATQVPQSQSSHCCGTVWDAYCTGGHKLLIVGLIPNVRHLTDA